MAVRRKAGNLVDCTFGASRSSFPCYHTLYDNADFQTPAYVPDGGFD
jgi:hypothetical protein